MAENARVLIITYLFPPSGGVGVPRFVSYARYLPEFVSSVSVLTASNPSTPVYDPELGKHVPPATKVFRAFNPELPYEFRDKIWKRMRQPSNATTRKSSKLKATARQLIQKLCFPDVQSVWIPFAIRAAKRIVRQEKINTVLLNAPPFSCLKIAVALRQAFPKLKLIIDFRDEWISNYLVDFDVKRTSNERRKAIELERRAIEAADFVSGITPAQTRQIRERYPAEPDRKFISVPNGYDAELFSGFRPRSRPGATNEKLVVTYFGTVYANPVYAPLWRYLDVIESLPNELQSQIETRFVGRVAREAMPLLEKYKSHIRFMGFFAQAAAVSFLEESDCQLMVSSNPTSHGGKLFDYLASGRPILALASPDGEIGKLISETRTGWCVDPSDARGIEAGLKYALKIKRGEAVFAPNRDAVRAYEWPNLVARMARLTGMVKNPMDGLLDANRAISRNA